MRHYSARCWFAASAVLVAFGLLFVSSAVAQDRPDAPKDAAKADAAAASIPRLASGHPDFSGFFRGNNAGLGEEGEQITTKTDDGSIFYAYGGTSVDKQLEGTVQDAIARDKNPPPYKPEYQKQVNELIQYAYGPRDNLKDPALHCKPDGVVRSPIDNMYIVQNDKSVGVMFEKVPGTYFRIIYTDGRQHPKDLDTSYYGDSIGHWEGDTLVVDTVGLNDETWLGGVVDRSLHSDQLHVVERWTRQANAIQVQMTVEDPVMFTRPWVLAPRHINAGPADDYLQPTICVDVTSAHQQVNSPKDTFKCNWCNSDSVYGGSGDKLTGPTTKPVPGAAGGGGGGE
jgi:hypothetical protein